MENIPKGWSLINFILTRKSLFSINKVEDFYIFYLGYIFSHSSEGKLDEYMGIMKNFISYITEIKFTNKFYKNHNWCQILRFHSSNDNHSLELLQMYLEEFKESEFYKTTL